MTNSERLRILYVDENRDSFDMLKVMLDIFHIDVDSARSIDDALARASSETFDLYVLDSGLPDGSGLSLCSMFRARNPEVPVLFYSGSALPEDVRSGMAAGAVGYITKPNSDKLADTIIQLVNGRLERRWAEADSGVKDAAKLLDRRASSQGRL